MRPIEGIEVNDILTLGYEQKSSKNPNRDYIIKD